jgi:hypothetical protein
MLQYTAVSNNNLAPPGQLNMAVRGVFEETGRLPFLSRQMRKASEVAPPLSSVVSCPSLSIIHASSLAALLCCA